MGLHRTGNICMSSAEHMYIHTRLWHQVQGSFTGLVGFCKTPGLFLLPPRLFGTRVQEFVWSFSGFEQSIEAFHMASSFCRYPGILPWSASLLHQSLLYTPPELLHQFQSLCTTTRAGAQVPMLLHKYLQILHRSGDLLHRSWCVDNM